MLISPAQKRLIVNGLCNKRTDLSNLAAKVSFFSENFKKSKNFSPKMLYFFKNRFEKEIVCKKES